jgi:hypothetical protein
MGARERQLLWASARHRGQFGAPRLLGHTDETGQLSLGVAPDGTVAAAWSIPNTEAVEDRGPVLRLLGPSDPDFGAPITFTPDAHLTYQVTVIDGGFGLALEYENRDPQEERPTSRVVIRRPDGEFDSPISFAQPTDRSVEGTIIFGSDGAPTAIAAAFKSSGTDCGEATFGQISAGPVAPIIVPTGLTMLSTPGAIASQPSGVTLTDGTLLVVWKDALDYSGRSRIEYAVRPPAGSFTSGRPLPAPAVGGYALAAGGGHAILAWVTGRLRDGPTRLAISTLSTTPPFAPVAVRPLHAKTPCQG